MRKIGLKFKQLISLVIKKICSMYVNVNDIKSYKVQQ